MQHAELASPGTANSEKEPHGLHSGSDAAGERCGDTDTVTLPGSVEEGGAGGACSPRSPSSRSVSPSLPRRHDSAHLVRGNGRAGTNVACAAPKQLDLEATGGGEVGSLANNEQPAECWICRESTGVLVQPCLCRGTMAGVHVSCVEAWVHCHHRSVQHELPQCPVCRAPYGGLDRRPGLHTFLRKSFRASGRQLVCAAGEALRLATLGALLAQLGGEGQDGRSEPCWALPPATIALSALILLKLAVLTASLPVGRGAPAWRWARAFFTPDLWQLTRTAADLCSILALLAWQCYRRELPYGHFALIGLAVVVPLVQLFLNSTLAVSIKEVLLFLSFLICMPVLIFFELGHGVMRHGYRLTNPLDGRAHVIIGLVAILLALGCRSLLPTTLVLVAHACFLGFGLLERAAVRRLPWRQGQEWFAAVLIAVEAVSIVYAHSWLTLVLFLVALRMLHDASRHARPQALFQGRLWWCVLLLLGEAINMAVREIRGDPAAATSAKVAAVIWLGLLCGLGFVVNWRRNLRHYRSWQRRHMTFVLYVPGQPFDLDDRTRVSQEAFEWDSARDDLAGHEFV